MPVQTHAPSAGRQAVRSGLCRKSRWGRGLQAMAWLGPDLVVCTALRAMLLRLASGQYTPLFALPSDAPTPLLVSPIPQARLALLVVVRPRPLCCCACRSWAMPAVPGLRLEPLLVAAPQPCSGRQCLQPSWRCSLGATMVF